MFYCLPFFIIGLQFVWFILFQVLLPIATTSLNQPIHFCNFFKKYGGKIRRKRNPFFCNFFWYFDKSNDASPLKLRVNLLMMWYYILKKERKNHWKISVKKNFVKLIPLYFTSFLEKKTYCCSIGSIRSYIQLNHFILQGCKRCKSNILWLKYMDLSINKCISNFVCIFKKTYEW